MGFWHTGYIEFHEPVGLEGYIFEASPPRYPCAHCDQTCASLDELRKHRFEAHPSRRPVMFLHGCELGTRPVRVTQPLGLADVRIDICDRATLNGTDMTVQTLSEKLTEVLFDVCRVKLSNAGVDADFVLDFHIASEAHLLGVEEQFERTALGRRLDTRAVEEFISATSGFGSAIGYCDGICSYLYGVLAKERAIDSSLSYEEYSGKFSKAADELEAYDRPLARTIGSLVEFHFNHFAEAARLAPDARLGYVANRYGAWLGTKKRGPGRPTVASGSPNRIEALVTDFETEQIVRWGIRPLGELSKDVMEIETFLKREIAEYDRVKLQVLLGELYVAAGDRHSALKHAKTLRNVAAFERWAESLIRANSEDDDERH